MDTVFSHIIQKRFSQVNEDVATDAFSFILDSSEVARKGVLKLIRGIVPDMPDLRFRTQQTEGSIRPDMWGFDGAEIRIFIENKFWAGLTDNQPVSYIKQLAKYNNQPTVLLMVVPAAREQTIWRELIYRLEEAKVTVSDSQTAPGIVQSVKTVDGPILALTSWSRLLSILEIETAEDQGYRNDLLQLRSLCDAADSQAFVPFSPKMTTDQRTPAFILQLSHVIQTSVESAVTKGILNTKKVLPQASWDRIGRYINFHNKEVSAWIGIRFDLWKQLGGTPLWLVFSPGKYCRGAEVYPLLQPWAIENNIIFSKDSNDEVAIGLDLLVGEEKDEVVRDIVERLSEIGDILSGLIKIENNPK